MTASALHATGQPRRGLRPAQARRASAIASMRGAAARRSRRRANVPAPDDPNPEPGGEPCPICGRPLVEGPSVNRHHVVPRSEGGRATARLHRICHRKLHSLWTERELARHFPSLEAVREHPEMQAFIRWVRRRPLEFYARTFDARQKGSRRG